MFLTIVSESFVGSLTSQGPDGDAGKPGSSGLPGIPGNDVSSLCFMFYILATHHINDHEEVNLQSLNWCCGCVTARCYPPSDVFTH